MMIINRQGAGIGFFSGFTSGIFAILMMLLFRYFCGIPTLAEQILDCATPLLPIPVFFGMLNAVRGYNHLKELGVFSTLFLIATVAGAIGIGYALMIERARRSTSTSPVSTAPSTAGIRFLFGSLAVVWILSVALLWPAMGASYVGRSPTSALAFNSLALLLILAMSGIILIALYRMLAGSRGTSEVPLRSRRGMVSGLVCGAGIVAVGAMLKKFYGFAALAYDGSETKGTDLPPITPNAEFYDVTKNSVDPFPDASIWSLEVVGSVTTSKRYRLAEIKAMPSTIQETTLECISNGVGGHLMSNGTWKGVPLQQLIQAAGPKPDVVQVVFHGADSYSDDVSLDIAMRPITLLAYEMNGDSLPMHHGYPLRMIVPGMVGEKSIKWLTRIEFRNQAAKQFYEKQGWGPKFEIVTTARFDAPDLRKPLALGAAVELGGIAFAGTRGVRRVEVSTDDGATWNSADIVYQRSPLSWVQWKYQWRPNETGTYHLVVRAIDGTGVVQSGLKKGAGPEPATGYHRVTATVTKPS